MMNFKNKTMIFAVVLGLLLSGCSDSGDGGDGGDGGGGDPSSQEINPPTAKISFPPPVSMTDASQIMVRGTAADETGISTVLVNGIAASTSDGFVNWQTVVPLDSGDNTLVVTTNDTLGNTNTDAANANIKRQTILPDATIGSGVKFVFLEGVALDAARNRALVTDSFLRALVAVDLTTGNRSILSDATRGIGKKFRTPLDVVLDAANNRALLIGIIEGGPSVVLFALFAVDLATGNRSILSDDTTGSGPKFGFPLDVVLDVANNRALLIDAGNLERGGPGGVLFAVDLTTGNRSTLSDDTTGSGPKFVFPYDIALDSANNRVLVIDEFEINRPGGALFSVDLATGNRSILSDDTTGSGPKFVFPTNLVLDAANNRALLPDNGLNALVAVDLTTGNRSIFSDPTTGSGPKFGFPADVLIDTANNRALVTDDDLHALFAVDLSNGERVIISR